MSKKVNKTNAVRLLDSKKINYDIFEYEVEDGLIDGQSVCEKLNVSSSESLKTLVARGKGKSVFVFVVAIDKELDLKKAAKISGEKKIEMLAVKDLLEVTGYIRGGCSPIGMKKHYPTYIDENVKDFPKVYVSGGRKGISIGIAPKELQIITESEFGDLT